MHLNMVLHAVLLKYSHFVAKSALFTLFLYIHRTAREFWNCCKNGDEHLALECHLIHSSIIPSMKTKFDINCFFWNCVLLIGPKNDDCAEEKPVHGLIFLRFDSRFFPPSLLPLFLSFPLYHTSFASFHLGHARLVYIWLHFQDRGGKRLFWRWKFFKLWKLLTGFLLMLATLCSYRV